jgi:hypothetical protein
MQDHFLTVHPPTESTAEGRSNRKGPAVKNNRRHGRVRCQDVECTLGSVMNISASGLLVRTGLRSPRVESVVVLKVRTFDGGFDVQTRVEWSKMDGLLHHQVGLEFIDLTPEGRRVLLLAVHASARG